MSETRDWKTKRYGILSKKGNDKLESDHINHQGRCIYGVIEANAQKSFSPIRAGDPPKEVYAVPWQDIFAVVSDSPVLDYHSMTKDRVVKDLLYHQSVIEKIMKDHTIVPMKFGTFVKENDEILGILKTGYHRFKEALSSISDKIEIDVAAVWNKELLFKEISEEDRIREFKEKITSNAAGPQLNDRITLGRMVEDSLKEKNQKCSQEILDTLRREAYDYCNHDTLDNTMILNSSFLLHKDKEKEFDSIVNELDSKYDKKINFKCVGPLAPYSFSTIEINKPSFDKINKARNLLGLSEDITPTEIKNAHRKLAFKYHPDNNPAGGQFDQEFTELTKAYKLLLEYCPYDSRSTRKKDVGSSVIINILKMAEEPQRKKH